jgi:WD40 repeat protein
VPSSNLGHDGIIKWWNFNSLNLDFTLQGHKPKGGEGVWDLQYHKSIANVMVSGGADNAAIIYNKFTH